MTKSAAFIGERNESSVLFSVATLGSFARGLPPRAEVVATGPRDDVSTPRANERQDGSGMVDIQALAASLVQMRAASAAQAMAAPVAIVAPVAVTSRTFTPLVVRGPAWWRSESAIAAAIVGVATLAAAGMLLVAVQARMPRAPTGAAATHLSVARAAAAPSAVGGAIVAGPTAIAPPVTAAEPTAAAPSTTVARETAASSSRSPARSRRARRARAQRGVAARSAAAGRSAPASRPSSSGLSLQELMQRSVGR